MSKYYTIKKAIILIIASLILITGGLAGLYLNNARKAKNKTYVPPDIVNRTPAPTEFRKIVDKWESFDYSEEISQAFQKTDVELLGFDIQPVNCLDIHGVTDNPHLWEWTDSQGLTDQFKRIENYEFSDEFVYSHEDGTMETANAGERSKKKIVFETICKNNSSYIVLFTTEDLMSMSLIPEAHAAGGWSAPYSLAYFDDKDFFILEKLPSGTKPIIVETPKNFGMPYYGCRVIYGFDENSVVLGCGGGDGPGGGSEIQLVNLKTKSIIEKAFCLSLFQEVHCYGEDGVEYYYNPPAETQN